MMNDGQERLALLVDNPPILHVCRVWAMCVCVFSLAAAGGDWKDVHLHRVSEIQ